MSKLYKLNSESPFFDYMQNTEIEDLMSDEERLSLYETVIHGIVSTQLDNFELSDDEIQFIIYANLNKKNSVETTDILVSNRLNNKI